MRVKDLWEVVPLPSTLHLFWTRVNLTKWTRAFFFLVLVHSIVQIGLQFGAYANNRATESSFGAIVADEVLTPKPFAFLEKNGTLVLCSEIPKQFGGTDPCVSLSMLNSPSGNITIFKRFSATPILSSGNVSTGVVLTGVDEEQPNSRTVVNPQCVQTFPWIFDIIHDATREDLVFVLYQGWLFSISVVAISKQSIPHIAAALASECLATVWSLYKIVKTQTFQNDYFRIAVNGVCGGVNVLPHYFAYRQAIEATILALNLVAFIGFVSLIWKLYKEFAPRMLKRVESRKDMERIYRVVLSLSTVLHLAAFFLVSVAGLFIDQLFIGRISALAKHLVAYEAIFLLVIALTIPWVLTGLVSTGKESRVGMGIFFGFSLLFLAIWGAMFASDIYRFMFFTWPFFATMSITACLLLVTVIGLSVYAFLNFGLGFPEYMNKSDVEDPADKVSWSLAYKGDLEGKGYDKEQADDIFTQYQPKDVARPQPTRSSSQTSGASNFSLDTTPSRAPRPLSKDTLRQPITQPIIANISLPHSKGNEVKTKRSQGSIKLEYPPGLDAPPRKPTSAVNPKPSVLIPTSRWSATTVASEWPSTPAPVSATGVTVNGSRRSKSQQAVNESRWSASTTATTTTVTTTSSRADEPPPVPELPRLPPSVKAAEISSLPRRNVI